MSSDEPRPETPNFGARFLDEWKRLGGLASAFSFAEIQELRGGGREDLIAVLRRHQPLIEYAALQRIRTVESPESLARDTLQQARAAANTNAWLMLALLT